MLKISDSAAQQILSAGTQAGMAGLPLRIAAMREPDGSVQYGMGFDNERDNDTQIVAAGVTLLISHHSRALLDGVTLDFVEINPGEFRFIFIGAEDSADAPRSGCAGGGCGSGGCASGGCH